jgi:hypothetical protein
LPLALASGQRDVRQTALAELLERIFLFALAESNWKILIWLKPLVVFGINIH